MQSSQEHIGKLCKTSKADDKDSQVHEDHETVKDQEVQAAQPDQAEEVNPQEQRQHRR